MKIHKDIVFDDNQNPIAVQIPLKEFHKLEEIIENYGLSKLIDEVNDDEQFSIKEAKEKYQSLKNDLED